MVAYTSFPGHGFNHQESEGYLEPAQGPNNTWEELWDAVHGTLNNDSLIEVKEWIDERMKITTEDCWKCKLIALRAFSYWRNSHSHE